MLADKLDYVIGVDTHRDEHVVAVVTAPDRLREELRTLRTGRLLVPRSLARRIQAATVEAAAMSRRAGRRTACRSTRDNRPTA